MKCNPIVLTLIAAVGLAMAFAGESPATILYDQNVTPEVIFGAGNTNGSFTVDTVGSMELGLRGKLRYNALGQAENTFNSNGDGTYSFDAIVAPTQSSPTAVWSFEWSINSNVDGAGGSLNGYTYALGLDSDPSAATNFALVFDPINQTYADHAIGDNTTPNGGGLVAADDPAYAALISQYNVAQNSWKAHWFISPFDPTVDGTYDIYLAAFDGGTQVARTEIQIIAGDGAAAIPEPASFAIWALLALVGVAVTRWRRR